MIQVMRQLLFANLPMFWGAVSSYEKGDGISAGFKYNATLSVLTFMAAWRNNVNDSSLYNTLLIGAYVGNVNSVLSSLAVGRSTIAANAINAFATAFAIKASDAAISADREMYVKNQLLVTNKWENKLVLFNFSEASKECVSYAIAFFIKSHVFQPRLEAVIPARIAFAAPMLLTASSYVMKHMIYACMVDERTLVRGCKDGHAQIKQDGVETKKQMRKASWDSRVLLSKALCGAGNGACYMLTDMFEFVGKTNSPIINGLVDAIKQNGIPELISGLIDSQVNYSLFGDR